MAATTITAHTKTEGQLVTLHKFPYPYQAMLTIASDCDGMTLRKFLLIHRFLNTREKTPMGKGLELDIADSFFFFVGTDRQGACDYDGTKWQDQMSYFDRLSTTDVKDGAAIASFTRMGWIDSLHSFGDFTMASPWVTLFQRYMAKAAVQALKENKLSYSVWINHGNESNVDNFGNPESHYQKGDLIRSHFYVTDLIVPTGVHYVWSRRDSEFGLQNELYPIVLRDGRKVWGFYRYTDDGYTKEGALTWNWNPRRLSAQLSRKHLAMIEKNHLYSIVAQHLGGNQAEIPIPKDGIASLALLAHEYQRGNILVTRTSRLLRYNELQQSLRFAISKGANHRIMIRILYAENLVAGVFQPTMDDLRGITFYTPDPDHTTVVLDGHEISERELVRNSADESGKKSISIRWWPSHVTDDTPPAIHEQKAAQGPPMPFTHHAPNRWMWSEDPL